MIDQHIPRKRFGQNFLVDPYIIENILNAIAPTKDEHIVEIGPGQGALTEGLLMSGARLDAIEIDRDLAHLLSHKLLRHKNFTLHCQDVLQFILPNLVKDRQKLRVVGNLPYNISTPLLFKLFADLDYIQDMFFMLQREVALRLIAQPNSKQYGRLSVMAQYYCDMQIILDVPPTAFSPAPKVDSCIVSFKPRTIAIVTDHAKLQLIVTTAFSHRRKTIANALKELFNTTELSQCGVDLQARAENINLNTYIQLANYFSNRNIH